MNVKTDVIIVGSGAAGLFAALHLPKDKNIIVISKDSLENCDSFLAQGGICVMRGEEDYAAYYEDTMKAGHYENREESVDIMLRSSEDVISDLVQAGVEFEKDGEIFRYTREGGHSAPRILFHADETGKEITSKLLTAVKNLDNVTLFEYTTMMDILKWNHVCHGIVAKKKDGEILIIEADYTIFACGGVGGLYKHSTNYKHITGDAVAIAIKHGIAVENVDYVQIHPTILYSKKPGRKFLISESVRGEGAHLLDKNGNRFVNELLPRDVVTKAIREQMEKDETEHVWLDMTPIDKDIIDSHFPNICKQCLEEGYDCKTEWIPVVPAQHYFMGGVKVDKNSATSMKHLYAIGETSCNGVHGANRLASNSLLESLVFAKRAALDIGNTYENLGDFKGEVHTEEYADEQAVLENYNNTVRKAIENGKEREK